MINNTLDLQDPIKLHQELLFTYNKAQGKIASLPMNTSLSDAEKEQIKVTCLNTQAMVLVAATNLLKK